MVSGEIPGHGPGVPPALGVQSKHLARTFLCAEYGGCREGSGEVVLHGSMEEQGAHRRDVHDVHVFADGPDDRRRPAGPYVRRHGADDLQSAVLDSIEAFGEKLWKATGAYDLSLAGVSALVVAGFIFNAFALASHFFVVQYHTMWTFWAIGTALWLFALAIFFLFLTDPAPRHRQRR